MVTHKGSGLLSFRTLECPFLATGARHIVFHIIISTLRSLTDRLRMCWKASLRWLANDLKTLGPLLYGPSALPQFPHPLISCCMQPRGEVRVGVPVGDGCTFIEWGTSEETDLMGLYWLDACEGQTHKYAIKPSLNIVTLTVQLKDNFTNFTH